MSSMPEVIDGRYEVYRVVLDYEALHEGFVDRVADLRVPRSEINVAGQFTPGYAAKLLCSPPMKVLGKDSLGKMLLATGMALVLVIDDARFAPIKAKMATHKRKQPAKAGSKNPAWLFRKSKARKMGKRRFALMTEAQLKKHQRKAGKASGAARRRKAMEKARSVVAPEVIPTLAALQV